MTTPVVPSPPSPGVRVELAGDHAVYVVAGRNHVTVLLDRALTEGAIDAIDVLAQPGGGPPPHKHSFSEWFLVLEGDLTLAEERNGAVVCTRVLRPGDAALVPPWAVHGTFNLSPVPARFQVVGRPGAMTGYFAEAGVAVPDELAVPTRPPAGPSELRRIAARWGIEFWTGPVDRTPPPEPARWVRLPRAAGPQACVGWSPAA